MKILTNIISLAFLAIVLWNSEVAAKASFLSQEIQLSQSQNWNNIAPITALTQALDCGNGYCYSWANLECCPCQQPPLNRQQTTYEVQQQAATEIQALSQSQDCSSGLCWNWGLMGCFNCAETDVQQQTTTDVQAQTQAQSEDCPNGECFSYVLWACFNCNQPPKQATADIDWTIELAQSQDCSSGLCWNWGLMGCFNCYHEMGGTAQACIANKEIDHAFLYENKFVRKLLQSRDSFEYEDIISHLEFTNSTNKHTNAKDSLEYAANLYVKARIEEINKEAGEDTESKEKDEMKQRIVEHFEDQWDYWRTGMNGDFFVKDFQGKYAKQQQKNQAVIDSAIEIFGNTHCHEFHQAQAYLKARNAKN